MTTPSPLADRLVTIFGGSGFIGKYVAESLLSRGARVRIASRAPDRSNSLAPLDNLDQLQFTRCNILAESSVEAALKDSDYVVNLVGAFTGNLEKLMGEAPGTIAQIARAKGVRGFVHVSAIGPDASSSAAYARAKASGERNVFAAFPSATVLRPSIVFGEDDNFLNMFGQMIQLVPALPVFGPEAKLQLVYANDIADAVAVSLQDPAMHGGHIYELGGPEQLSMMEINQRIAAAQGRRRGFIPMPDALSAFFAALPLTPMSKDQWTLLKPGSTISGEQRTFAELGIEPKPLGLFLDKWMARFRRFGRVGVSTPRQKKARKDSQLTAISKED